MILSFKNNKVGNLSEVSHELFSSMTMNDEIIKAYSELCAGGVLGYAEIESPLTVSAPDETTASASNPDQSEDPDWLNIFTLTFLAEEFHAIKFSIIGSTITHQALPQFDSGFQHAINMRINLNYLKLDDEESVNISPYRFVAPGAFVLKDKSYEFGKLYGTQVVLALSNFTQNAEKFRNLTLMKSGVVKASLEIKKLRTNQVINASPDSKFQFFIEDMGVFK
jgi:hypothetical protein